MAKKLIERPFNSGTMTNAQFFGKIRSTLRKSFMYWKPIMEALKAASRPSENKENKLLKTEYQCAICKNWFKRTDVHVDHVVECGSLRSYDDVVPFIKRLTTEGKENYQVLCKKTCHLSKSVAKNAENRKNKEL